MKDTSVKSYQNKRNHVKGGSGGVDEGFGKKEKGKKRTMKDEGKKSKVLKRNSKKKKNLEESASKFKYSSNVSRLSTLPTPSTSFPIASTSYTCTDSMNPLLNAVDTHTLTDLTTPFQELAQTIRPMILTWELTVFSKSKILDNISNSIFRGIPTSIHLLEAFFQMFSPVEIDLKEFTEILKALCIFCVDKKTKAQDVERAIACLNMVLGKWGARWILDEQVERNQEVDVDEEDGMQVDEQSQMKSESHGRRFKAVWDIMRVVFGYKEVVDMDTEMKDGAMEGERGEEDDEEEEEEEQVELEEGSSNTLIEAQALDDHIIEEGEDEDDQDESNEQEKIDNQVEQPPSTKSENDKSHFVLPVSHVHPSVIRLVASAFSQILRRAKTKGGELRRVIDIMLMDTVDCQITESNSTTFKSQYKNERNSKWKGKGKNQDVEHIGFSDAISLIICEACKSIPPSLHGNSKSIVQTLTDIVAHQKTKGGGKLEEEAERTLIKVVTGLIHFTSQGENVGEEFGFGGFEGNVTDVVISRFENMLNHEEEQSLESVIVKRLIGIVIAIVGGRKGKKISDTVKKRFLIVLQKICSLQLFEKDQALRDKTLELTVFLFLTCSSLLDDSIVSTTFNLWLKLSNRSDQDEMTEDPSASLIFTLIKLNWSRWSSFGSNLTRKWMLNPFSRKCEKVKILAELCRQERLKFLLEEGGLAMIQHVKEILEEDMPLWLNISMGELVDELTVIGGIKDSVGQNDLQTWNLVMMKFVKELINKVKDEDEAKTDFALNEENVSLRLSWILKTYFALEGRLTDVELENVLERWSWNKTVLISLDHSVESLVMSPSHFEKFVDNLRSEDRQVRLSTLQLLQLNSKSALNADILNACIAIENIPLLPQSIREFSVTVKKLAQLTSKMAEQSVGMEENFRVVISYMFGLLKVNFQPLWGDAIAALVVMTKAVPNLVSPFIVTQIEMAARSDVSLRTIQPPTWKSTQEEITQAQSPVFEFRDSNVFNVRNQLQKGQIALKKVDIRTCHPEEVERQLPEPNFNATTYETQLLKFLGQVPEITPKVNRNIVSTYFDHVVSSVIADDQDEPITEPRQSARSLRLRVATWLRMFSKFSNLKASYKSPDLRASFFSNLGSSDVEVQQTALECCLAWKSVTVERHAEFLRDLLDEKKFRESLMRLSSSVEGQGLSEEDRKEIVPYSTRILYGLARSRSGKAAQSGRGQALRRNAILSALQAGSEMEIDQFFELLLEPFEDIKDEGPSTFHLRSTPPKSSFKQQIGFLNLFQQSLKRLWIRVTDARKLEITGLLVNILHFAQETLSTIETRGQAVSPIYLERIRTTRRLGLRCFIDLVRNSSTLDLDVYLRHAFTSFVSPRLASFATDSAQAPSPLLDLVIFWSETRSGSRLMFKYDTQLLPAIYRCLSVKNAKPVVLLKVFDILQNQITLDDPDEFILPVLPHLLSQLGDLFRSRSIGTLGRDEVTKRFLVILTQLAPLIRSTEAATNFIPLLLRMLRRPNGSVPENAKNSALVILSTIVESLASILDDSTLDTVYEALSEFFLTLRWRAARPHLVRAFRAVATVRESLLEVAQLLEHLNAFSRRRVEEPDYEARLSAFEKIKDKSVSYTLIQWKPLVQNSLAFLQDDQELAMRTNSSDLLRAFATLAFSTSPTLLDYLQTTVLASLRKILRSRNENVSSEALAIYGQIVQGGKEQIPELQQLSCLLVDGDREANVFYNLYHIQIHRRTRAWRRIADEAEAGNIPSKLLDSLFSPLLDNNLLSETTKVTDFQNELVLILTRFSTVLDWGSYRRKLQKYEASLKASKVPARFVVRCVVAILRGFHFSLDDDTNSHILGFVSTRLIPDFIRFLDRKEDVDEALRIPVGEGIAQVIKHLGDDKRNAATYTLLASLSQILKSTSQDTRELTRTSLGNVVTLLGPDALQIATKELTGALKRGPQLHVLAFSVHQLLVKVSTIPDFSVDSALEDILPILEDDIFGAPARDRQNNEFRARTKFREVRAAKSGDSFQLLAQTISPSKITTLLLPLRSVLQRISSSSSLHDAEEVFRRISAGLVENPKLGSDDILRLCNSLISQDSDFFRLKSDSETGSKVHSRYRVQMSRSSTTKSKSFGQNRVLFTSFGLELFSTSYKRNVFDVHNTTTLAHLDKFMQTVGNCLYSENATVLAKALKVTSLLVQCPLPSSEKTAPVLIRQILVVLRQAGGTASELAQSCLRTLALTIRDCKTASLSETQLRELMKLMAPDLEEIDRQTVIFALLRSIMSRKFISPEVYDLMDRVAEILVTNQAKNVRQVCRAIYLQFLLDYPQSRSRLKASLTFLAKNLSYEHESGRLSVLELLNAVINKFTSSLLNDHISLFFVALVMMIANDSSSRCREVAFELVKMLITKSNSETKTELTQMLFAWAEQRTQLALSHSSIQVIAVMIEVIPIEESEGVVTKAFDLVHSNLKESGEKVTRIEQDFEDEEESNVEDVAWQIPYYSLQVATKLISRSPSRFISPSYRNYEFWTSIQQHLLFPHAWVRSISSRIFGQLFAATPKSNLGDITVSQDHPLSMWNLVETARKMTLQLRSLHLDDALALQIVKNLVFILKYFEATKHQASTDEVTVEDEGDDVEDEEREERKVPPDATRWLCGRMSRQLRASHDARPSLYEKQDKSWTIHPCAILKWFAACMEILPSTKLETLLVQIMTPIYRIVNQEVRSEDEQSVKLQTLALEVQELLQSKISVEAFTRTLTNIQKRATQKRFDRKAAEALIRVSAPEAYDKRRMARNAQKVKSRKRKNESFEQGRYAMHNGNGSGKKRRTDR